MSRVACAGWGSALIAALIADAENADSLAFHAQPGFVQVAHFRGVGRKFGRWLDLAFVPLSLDQSG